MSPSNPIAPATKRLVIALPQSWLDDFVGPDGVARLRAAFDDCVTLPAAVGEARRWADDVVAARPHAILSGWGTPPIPAAAMPPLAIVAHTAGSVRGLVTREMIARGLLVTNWGPAAAPAVAEAALMLVLACLRRLNHWSLVMHRDRGWGGLGSAESGVGLYGRRVAIHGFGNIARQFVRLISPFGCDVSAYSAGVPSTLFAEHGVRPAPSLEALFAGAEVLVEAEALTDASRGSVTEALLRSLAEGAAFVNVGRGAVVNERALERVAAEGRLQVGLDVYEREPLPASSPLRGLPNVTLTPHVAGPTRDQRRACGARAVEALCRFAAGEPIDRPIGVDEFDRST